jgi:hypothetical protein
MDLNLEIYIAILWIRQIQLQHHLRQAKGSNKKAKTQFLTFKMEKSFTNILGNVLPNLYEFDSNTFTKVLLRFCTTQYV